MAEKGAHLTGTLFAKPSIFEIAAQKSLAATLEPAAKKIITFLASVNPEKYTWLHQWSDEIYLILITTLQNYYLNNYCNKFLTKNMVYCQISFLILCSFVTAASFSETFYGLKRIVIQNSHIKSNLNKKRLNLSLIILVLFPYLQRKIENLENQHSELNRVHQNKWKNYVIQSYKVFRALKEILTLYQYLLYLSNKSKYPTLSLRFLSISLTYANNDNEIGLIELAKKLGQRNFTANDGLEILRLSVVRSIEIGAFFLQFLQWWNQEHYYNFNLMALPVPPPPQIPEFAKQYKGICPICRKTPWIHTVIASSGFIYCYQCILPQIKKHQKCPVTGYPAKEDDLIRLYIN